MHAVAGVPVLCSSCEKGKERKSKDLLLQGRERERGKAAKDKQRKQFDSPTAASFACIGAKHVAQAADYLTKACPGALVRRFQSALDGSDRDNAGSVIASTATSPPGAVGSGLHGRSPFASPFAPTNQPIMTNRATHLHL